MDFTLFVFICTKTEDEELSMFGQILIILNRMFVSCLHLGFPNVSLPRKLPNSISF